MLSKLPFVATPILGGSNEDRGSDKDRLRALMESKMGEAKEALRSLTKELIQEKTALIERQFDIGERKLPENEMAWIHNETLDRSNQVNQKVNAFLESLSKPKTDKRPSLTAKKRGRKL
ncbi:hypothetical protein BaRGS_00024402 [Batillaria attramentaria]|uniref:Uncharacterized protein n=1 Tax=Batillaria attramentaria TaxID=370345 RepID=A0ABD0KBI6_9CAEN